MYSSDDEDSSRKLAATGTSNEIFAEDPWNAMCVLGLRVYSLQSDVKISVIKGKNSS